MPYKGYKKPERIKKKISETMKRIGGNSGTWKKGQEAWNYEGKGKLKRKMKKWNGKSVLNSHYIYCKANGLKSIPKGYVIHHRDFNSLNDNIDNLMLMTDKGHKSMHNFVSKMKRAGDKLI